MGQALTEPPALPPLDETTARENVDVLRRLGAEYGISELRFASPGRIIGHLEEDRDLADVVLSSVTSKIFLVSMPTFHRGLIGKPGVSADLLTARPL